MQDEIHEKHFNFEDIVNGIPGGFFVYYADGDEELIYVNDEVLHIFHCATREEFRALTGNTFKGFVHPDDIDRVEQSITEQISHNQRDLDYVEYRIIQKGGAVRWVEDFGHLVRNAAYGDLFYVFISDITEKVQRREAERHRYAQTLREKELLDASVRSLVQAYREVDYVSLERDYYYTIYPESPEGHIHRSYSHTVEQYVADGMIQSDPHLSHEDILNFLRPDCLRKTLSVHPSAEYKYYCRTSDGGGEWRVVTFALYEHREGVPLSAVMAVRSIEDIVAKEEEQKEALARALSRAESADRAKTRFLSNMSHDIRTPMNAIIGFTAIAASHIDQRERVLDCLEKITRSSNHLLSLINDVLDMSKIESGKIQLQEHEDNLSDILHNFMNIIHSQIVSKGLELYVDTLDVLHENVLIDALRLNQVLLNVVGNAIKFTEPGGTISLRLKELPSQQSGTGLYQITVKDTGIGISPDFLPHIFETFAREQSSTISRIEGTGLGLPIAKNIIEMMGGTITAASEPGRGTTFTITVPLKFQNEAVTSPYIPQLDGLRALVADDDYDVCNSVCKMLGQIGMIPDWTLSGHEAILRAKQAQEMGKPYSVYILDWQIPDLNGLDVTHRIRKIVGDEAPIYVLTAYDSSQFEDKAKQLGVTSICHKPLFMSNLRNTLLQACGIAPQPVGEPEHPHWHLEGKRVLLAEDNELNSEIATEILSEAGLQVETAVNGKIAVEKVRASHAGYYDAVLMDVQMPVMDGYHAARAIRALEDPQLAAIPIIAMTANAFEEDRQEALRNGMNAHIAKPIDINAFMAILQEILD